MIEGVLVTPLRRIGDERGMVMHMLRADAPHFQGFGEIYFSTVKPGVIKGWHRHSRAVANYAVPVGQIRLVLLDRRPQSATVGQQMDLVLGGENYALVTIPAGLWYAFQGLGPEEAVVANCATLPHTPGEADKCALDDPAMPRIWGD